MAELLLMGRTGRRWRWHACLAGWLAVLLALAPLAQRPLPLDPTPGRAADQLSARHGHAGASLAGLQPAEPAGLGIIARPSLIDPIFGPAPAKPLLRTSVPEAWTAAPEPARAPEDAARSGVDRSSVGTARTPTGPPA